MIVGCWTSTKKNRKSWSQLITTTESYTLGVQRKKTLQLQPNTVPQVDYSSEQSDTNL